MGGWFASFSVTLRVVSSMVSIRSNSSALGKVYDRGIVLRLPQLNEFLYKLYALISAQFVLFSIFELLTLNVHVSGVFDNNFVGLLAIYYPEACAIIHGMQIACYINNALLMALTLFYQRLLVLVASNTANPRLIPFYRPFTALLCMLTTFASVMLGYWFGTNFERDPPPPEFIPTDAVLPSGLVSLLVSNFAVHHDTLADKNHFVEIIEKTIGFAFLVAATSSASTHGIVGEQGDAVLERYRSVDSGEKMSWALFLTVCTTFALPATIGICDISTQLAGHSIMPLEFVMLSFNLTAVLFPLIQCTIASMPRAALDRL